MWLVQGTELQCNVRFIMYKEHVMIQASCKTYCCFFKTIIMQSMIQIFSMIIQIKLQCTLFHKQHLLILMRICRGSENKFIEHNHIFVLYLTILFCRIFIKIEIAMLLNIDFKCFIICCDYQICLFLLI